MMRVGGRREYGPVVAHLAQVGRYRYRGSRTRSRVLMVRHGNLLMLLLRLHAWRRRRAFTVIHVFRACQSRDVMTRVLRETSSTKILINLINKKKKKRILN